MAGWGIVFPSPAFVGFPEPIRRIDSLVHAEDRYFLRKKDGWAIGHNGRYAVGVWVGRLSGMGDQAYAGSRSAEPLLARIFDLAHVRRMDSMRGSSPMGRRKPHPFAEERPAFNRATGEWIRLQESRGWFRNPSEGKQNG